MGPHLSWVVVTLSSREKERERERERKKETVTMEGLYRNMQERASEKYRKQMAEARRDPMHPLNTHTARGQKKGRRSGGGERDAYGVPVLPPQYKYDKGAYKAEVERRADRVAAETKAVTAALDAALANTLGEEELSEGQRSRVRDAVLSVLRTTVEGGESSEEDSQGEHRWSFEADVLGSESSSDVSSEGSLRLEASPRRTRRSGSTSSPDSWGTLRDEVIAEYADTIRARLAQTREESSTGSQGEHQDVVIPPRPKGRSWCTSTVRRHESLVYPAASQPLDKDPSAAAAGAVPLLFELGPDVPTESEFNALLHGGGSSGSGNSSVWNAYPKLRDAGVPRVSESVRKAGQGARVFSKPETSVLLGSSGDDAAAGESLGLRSILWADECESRLGQFEHFALRRKRIASAPTEDALKLEAIDLFLEQLRRKERRLIIRKREEELDKIRGPVPKWYELKDASFNGELKRHNAVTYASPETNAERLAYASELLSTPIQ